MRKKYLAVFTVLLMSISTIIGCSSTADSNKNDDQAEAETVDSITETDEADGTDEIPEEETDAEADNSVDEEIEDQEPEIEYETLEYGGMKVDIPSTWKEEPAHEFSDGGYSIDIEIPTNTNENMHIYYSEKGEEILDETYFSKQLPNDINLISNGWENYNNYKTYHNFIEFNKDSSLYGFVKDFYFFPFANDTKYLSVQFKYLPENAEAYTEIFNHILESVDLEELISEHGPALEMESDDEATDDGQNVEAKKEQADTFVSSGAPKALAGFLDFRGTGFTVTIPENKQSTFMPEMTEGSVSFSDETHEIQSCDAVILYETEGKAIHQILVLAPDAETVESGRFKELISTIIVQMGITDFEEASEMVDSAYEVEEPIVENNTYLQMNNTLDHGFLIKY